MENQFRGVVAIRDKMTSYIHLTPGRVYRIIETEELRPRERRLVIQNDTGQIERYDPQWFAFPRYALH